MLVLTRHEDESLTITLDSGIDPMTPACELFAGGLLVITVLHHRGGMVRLGAAADSRLTALRAELASRGTAENGRHRMSDVVFTLGAVG